MNAVELGLVRLVLNCIAAAFLVSRIVGWDGTPTRHDSQTVGSSLKAIAFSRVVHQALTLRASKHLPPFMYPNSRVDAPIAR